MELVVAGIGAMCGSKDHNVILVCQRLEIQTETALRQYVSGYLRRSQSDTKDDGHGRQCICKLQGLQME